MHPDDPILSDRTAAAVLRRAAQLQAEAAIRMEERSRLLAASAGDDEPTAPGLRLSDVEAAAAEAGISPEYVKLALAEETGADAGELPEWRERAATRLLGVSQRSLEVTRAIAAEPAAVFEAMQRVLPVHPYLLRLVSIVGRDPLNGAILVFTSPDDWTEAPPPLAVHMMVMGIKQLRMMLRPVPGEPPSCQVVVAADLRRSVRISGWTSAGLSGVAGAGGAAAAWVGGASLLSLGGALLALPAAAAALAAGGLTAVGCGASYRQYLRKLAGHVGDMLQALDTNARTGGAFAVPLAPPPPTGPWGIPGITG